jgi:acetyltransferase
MNHDAYRSRHEERALMPGTAPRLRAVARNGDGREMDMADWECGVLAEQLDAFGRDIRAARGVAARAAAGRPRSVHGVRATNGGPRGERVVLAAETEVLIRPVEAADSPALRDAFERLGALSRLRRFLTPVEHLTRHQLEYLSNVDHDSHEALLAFDARTGEAVGVARYIRDERDGESADVAVVVADRWQGRGIGSALLSRLAARAARNGFRHLTATILTGNDAAARLLGSFPIAVRARRIAGATRVTADLPTRGA